MMTNNINNNIIMTNKINILITYIKRITDI